MILFICNLLFSKILRTFAVTVPTTLPIEQRTRVGLFAKYLTNDLHLNFHPDDDFSFYVNYETKEPTFSPEKAAKYNAIMNECFDVCEKANVDVYEVIDDYLRKAIIA